MPNDTELWLVGQKRPRDGLQNHANRGFTRHLLSGLIGDYPAKGPTRFPQAIEGRASFALSANGHHATVRHADMEISLPVTAEAALARN